MRISIIKIQSISFYLLNNLLNVIIGVIGAVHSEGDFMDQSEYQNSAIGLEEIVDTLTSIAELDPEVDVAYEIGPEKEIEQLSLSQRARHWFHCKNSEKVMHVCKDALKAALGHLKDFYSRQVGHFAEPQTIESVQQIMGLVGKAATRLDSFTRELSGRAGASIKKSPEFRQLVSFYEKKVSPIIAQKELAERLKILPAQAILHEVKKVIPIRQQRVFADLETVKRDDAYELFFIRRQDGQRYFSPGLLRNVKIVSHLEEYFGAEEKTELYNGLKADEAILAQTAANDILKGCWEDVDLFVHLGKQIQDHELAKTLYSAIMALFLASQESATIASFGKKSAGGYFQDFQKFIREVVSSPRYQKLLAYDRSKMDPVDRKVTTLIAEMLLEEFTGRHFSRDLLPYIEMLIQKGKAGLEEVEHLLGKPGVSSRFALNYEALLQAAIPLNYVPLLKTVETLQDPDIRGFDPLLFGAIPSLFFELDVGGHEISVLKTALPTHQIYVDHADVIEEFKDFVRAIMKEKPARKLLLFNIEDRTSWKEYSRATAIEELQKKEEFHKALVVIGMSKDGDFYHQNGPYEKIHDSKEFLKALLEHTSSESSGYYYPEKIRKALFNGFANNLSKALFSIFFHEKNVLSRSERLEFIELFLLFLQLKIIELVHPHLVTMCCKDSIDIGIPNEVELFVLLKLFNRRLIAQEELENMELFLFGCPLLYRGRPLDSDRFTRMNSLIKLIENTQEEWGEEPFSDECHKLIYPLFSSKILTALTKI